MKKLRISIEKTWWKIGVCLFLVLFGIVISIGIGLANSPTQQETVEGLFMEYHKVGGGTDRSHTRYMTLNIPEQGTMEYIMPSVVGKYFLDEKFMDDVQPGDTVSLILDGDSILAVSSGDTRYLSISTSLDAYAANRVTGLWVGGVCVAIGLIAFCTLVKIRWVHHRKKRRKQLT